MRVVSSALAGVRVVWAADHWPLTVRETARALELAAELTGARNVEVDEP